MSDIMPGQPGDTNTSARFALLHFIGEDSDEANALIDDFRAEVLDDAIKRLQQTYHFAPDPEYRPGINFAIGVLMSVRGAR